jgi:hypothetical protein
LATGSPKGFDRRALDEQFLKCFAVPHSKIPERMMIDHLQEKKSGAKIERKIDLSLPD